MEDCCTTGSQGSLSSPDASKHDVVTSPEKSTDCDRKVLNVISDVLKRVVNSIENTSADCESNILSKTSENQSGLLTENRSSSESDSMSDDKCLTEKDEGSEITSETPVNVAKDHDKDVKSDVVFETVEITGTADTTESGEVVFESTSKEPRSRKTPRHGRQEKNVKQLKGSKQKHRRHPDNVIDKLFHAAQSGDKEDFKKLLYVNYDNIVNGYIDSKQSDSCISTSEDTDKEIEHQNVHVKQNVETPEQDVKKSDDGKTTYHDELTELDSKLVICVPEKNQAIPGKESSDTDSSKSSSPLIPKRRRKTCVKDNKQTDSNKESANQNSHELNLKRKIVSDFKEISRGVAFKKLRTYLDGNGSEIPLKQPIANDSEPITVTGLGFVKVENIKQELSTDDNVSSSDLDDSFSQKIIYVKQPSYIKTESTSDSSNSDGKHEFTCQHCYKKYKNLVYLRNHQTSNHLHEDTFMCEACSKVFFSLEKLKEHEKVHVKEDIAYCELCKKSYSSRAAIRRHSETVHVVEKQRPHKCEVCNYAFTCMWHLREHYRIHTDQRDYVCPVCSRAFNHIGSMNRHAKDQHNFDTSSGTYFDRKPQKPVVFSPVKVHIIKKPQTSTATEPAKEATETPGEKQCGEEGERFQPQFDGIEIKVEREDPEDID